MATVDVPAATSAWLARLPEAQRIAAQAATDARLAGFLTSAIVFAAAVAIVSRSRLIEGLTRRIEAGRARPWLASAAAAGVLALVLSVAMALAGSVAAWRVGSILAAGGGVPPDVGLGRRLATALAGVAPAITAAFVLAPPLAWLISRLPRTWPLIAGVAAMTPIITLVWLPYALSAGGGSAPAPPGPTRDAVAGVIAEARLPATGVWFNPDPSFDVDVSGGFGRAKVTIGPKLMAMPPAEASALTGHLMGHYVHHDILLACLAATAAIFIGLLVAQRWGVALARSLGATAVSTPAQPAALPALALIGAVTLTCAWLAVAGYLRWANVGADAYSLGHARAPDGLAAVIEREWDHDAVAPSAPETALFYSHPPLKDRVAHAMAWKAANGG